MAVSIAISPWRRAELRPAVKYGQLKIANNVLATCVPNVCRGFSRWQTQRYFNDLTWISGHFMKLKKCFS
jgi:hypothetical protein